MEAMACGCIVVGYDGRGGAEFMRPPFALPVPAENILAFAQTLENLLKFIESSPREVARLGMQASQFIHSTYTPEQERDDLLTAVRTLMMHAIAECCIDKARIPPSLSTLGEGWVGILFQQSVGFPGSATDPLPSSPWQKSPGVACGFCSGSSLSKLRVFHSILVVSPSRS